jgi:aminoglycoside phosphotransferase (APT) family kinase protein
MWQAEAVRYRVDLRASVKLTVRATESGSGRASDRRFFAKVYAGKEQGERAWSVQQELAAGLRAASEPFGIAPLVTYLPEDRVLVQEEVQGLGLSQIIRRCGPEKTVEAIRRAARAIAALHRLPMTAPEHRIALDRTDPGRLRRSAETLQNARPDLADAVAEIEAQILAGLEAIGNLPAVPVHGDLKPGHLLFEEDRVVLLDLDKFAAGEPMLDVANILMPLRREWKTELVGTSLARVFAEEYFSRVPAAWEQRFTPHYAWAILSEATTFAVSPKKNRAGAETGRAERREHDVDILIEEARAILAGRA